MLETVPQPGPVLSLAERDRRWAGLRAIMRARRLAAIVVGSFNGRERLESYLIDDFLDAVVVLPLAGDPTVLSFSTQRTSRALESERRGYAPWARDLRIGAGGAGVAALLRERDLATARVGIVGFGPTAPGETEGLLPLGFYRNLTAALPRLEIEDFTRDLTDFMLVKSTEEIALLRFAARVSEEACRAMIAAAQPGTSEAEVYAEIMRTIYRWGCETRYPNLSLQSGPDNIGWGAPRWALRAEPPRVLEPGDMVQAEIHTLYGGLEAQVQMSVALEPIGDALRACERAAGESYAAGVAAVRPGVTFAEVVRAMEEPLRRAGCWSKTPLAHTMSFGATGFSALNREQLSETREAAVEGQATVGTRRGEIVLVPGMVLELEPNACLGMARVNVGAGVLVTPSGAEELNVLATRVYHRGH
jgi:Xaa-Pro aminopeptidase